MTWHASSTLTSISQLSGLKNQNMPESGEPASTTLPEPVWPAGSSQATSTLKRPPLRHIRVGLGTQEPLSRAAATEEAAGTGRLPKGLVATGMAAPAGQVSKAPVSVIAGAATPRSF